MIRLLNVYFPRRTLLLALTEAALISLSLLAAMAALLGQDTELALLHENGIWKMAVVCTVCMLFMHYYDLYDSNVMCDPTAVLTRLVQVLGTSCLALGAFFYLFPMLSLQHDLLLLWLTLTALALAVSRRLFLAVARSRRLSERIVLLGEGPLTAPLVREIEARAELGLRLAGFVGSGAPAGCPSLAHLGSVEELGELVEQHQISRIVVTMGERRGGLPVELLLHLKTQGIRVQDAAEFFEAVAGQVPLALLRPSWLVFSDGFRISWRMLVFKRAASVVLASACLVLALPVLAAVAIAVKLDSAGPVLFRQKRIGKDGRPFTMIKFRSMRDGADGDTCRPAQEHDDRTTRVGGLIRKAHLDELPQLWNILRGDMYFIGPRPFIPESEREYSAAIPFYRERWSVKPGMTGWAQVRRGYCASLEDNVEKLAYDLYYIKHISVGLDLLIAFQTLKILALGRGAR